jgi:hypothetical protein
VSTQDTSALSELRERLRQALVARGAEIEEALIARFRDNEFDLPLTPEFTIGAFLGATEAMDMMLESFDAGLEWSPKLPPETATMIRFLAREEVPMALVLRFSSLVGGVFLETMFNTVGDVDAKVALHFMASWGTGHLDRLIKLFAAEYIDEERRLNSSPTRELRGRVGRLLKGGTNEAADLGYRMNAWHTGLIVTGDKGDLVCRRLAEKLGCDLLIVPDAEGTYWAWLAAQSRVEVATIERALPAAGVPAIAAGEPREGANGWRLTHKEALSALPVARLEGPGLVRHSNIALLASALCDAATGRSLMDRYLTPLDSYRDADELRGTLRTYFGLSCNAVSTASALGVNRHTVQRRLKRVEEAVGEPPSVRQAEFGVALELEQVTTRTRAAFNEQRLHQ